ncbi:BNR-4 repeat-containing protein [Pontiella sulfatireligans]|uniref:Ig-like domain-containing protein n=1 Tax=Pontiella sulfatireligans TaxID=2750658 RepID=A0A6C2UHF8_9BACT|nr:BNR-4 repeat-containing protein [Pontiella sulfatireligans]VGO18636.1 hypothetical protein SCARR_00689 [Pontiella sulfatireligans]
MKNRRKALLFISGFLGITVHAATNPPPQYPLYAEADELYSNTNTYDLTQETYTFSTLWSTPAQEELNFLPGSYHSPIATRGDDTFVLFVDTDHRMKIAHLTNGLFKGETFIDNTLYQPDEFYDGNGGVPGYHTVLFEDGHHSCSLGIDENGYLHIVGDMHNYPRWSTNHLPLRYHDKNIMYWRSDNPLDASSFSFKGDQAGQCPPGYGFTYQFFFNDLNGMLHMTSRTHQWTNNSTRCATYSRFDADTGLWSIIGGLDPDDPNSEPRTFYDDGREYDLGNINNKYSKTCPHGVFDRNNNMHLVTPLLSNPTLNPWGMGSGQHFVDTILYAQSTNGTDYAKADGSSITLPATIDLTSNHADIIYNAPTDRYLSVLGNMAVDYQNNPYTVVRQKSYDPNDNNADNQSIVLGWDGNAWTNYGEIVVATTDFRLVHDPAGVMSYIPDSLDRFYRFWNPSETPEQVNLPAAWPYIKTIDYEYLKKTGDILGLSKIGGELTVVKVEINNRPGMALIDPPVETPANHAPVITAPATATGYDLSVAATDADGDPLTYTWEKTYGPGDASFSVNGTATSSNTTISVSELGTYEFKVVVSDGTDPRISTCYLLATGPGIPATIFQIGGLTVERDTGWNSLVLNASTGTYSFADTEDTNLVFTLTAVALNGDTLDLNSTHLGVDSTARQTDPKTGRINLDEAIVLTVSYVDPSNSLVSLDVDKFGLYWGNGATETTVFTDARANSTNMVAFDHTLYNNLVDYDSTGLDPLTKYNTANWSMTVSIDDTLGLTQSGMGGFMLAYVVDVGGDNLVPYDQWAGSYYPAIHDNDGYGDDAEPGGGDGMVNLVEYALGGNPLVDDATTKLPTIGISEEGGTNWFNYIYNRRLDASARNLTYEVFVTTNLVSGAWTNTTEEAGLAVINADFESVTNRVSNEVEMQQFMKLEIGITE